MADLTILEQVSLLMVGLAGVVLIFIPERGRRGRIAINIAYTVLAVGLLIRVIDPELTGVKAIVQSPTAFPTAILTAVVLYRARGVRPFAYGLLEVAVALIILRIVTLNTTIPFEQQLTAALAGVYFLIRGLDNMDRGLPARLRPVWDRLFPKDLPAKELPPHVHTGAP